MPHRDFKDPIYFSLLPAPRIFRTLVYPSHNLTEQKLNTGNHKKREVHTSTHNVSCGKVQGDLRRENPSEASWHLKIEDHR